MTQKQENKYASYGAVIQTFNDFQEAVDTIPALTASATSVKTYYNDIAALATKRKNFGKGVWQDKTDLKAEVGELGLRLAKAIVTYANLNSDTVLANSMAYKATDFARFSDVEMETVAQSVLNKTEEMLVQLKEVGVDAEDVKELRDKLALYKTKKTAPRNQLNHRKTMTSDLRDLFTGVDATLKDCDNLVLQLKKKQPVFFNTYRASRLIVNRGGSRSNGSNGIVQPSNGNGTTAEQGEAGQ